VVAEDGGELEFGAGRRNDGECEGAQEENEFFHRGRDNFRRREGTRRQTSDEIKAALTRVNSKVVSSKKRPDKKSGL
jgi:hypothetical protein